MKEALKKSFEVLLKNGEYAEAEKLLVSYIQVHPGDYEAQLLVHTCRIMNPASADSSASSWLKKKSFSFVYDIIFGILFALIGIWALLTSRNLVFLFFLPMVYVMNKYSGRELPGFRKSYDIISVLFGVTALLEFFFNFLFLVNRFLTGLFIFKFSVLYLYGLYQEYIVTAYFLLKRRGPWKNFGGEFSFLIVFLYILFYSCSAINELISPRNTDFPSAFFLAGLILTILSTANCYFQKKLTAAAIVCAGLLVFSGVMAGINGLLQQLPIGESASGLYLLVRAFLANWRTWNVFVLLIINGAVLSITLYLLQINSDSWRRKWHVVISGTLCFILLIFSVIFYAERQDRKIHNDFFKLKAVLENQKKWFDPHTHYPVPANKKFSVNIRSGMKLSAIEYCCLFCNKIIKSHYFPQHLRPPVPADPWGPQDNTSSQIAQEELLFQYIEKKNHAGVKLLISKGVDVNTRKKGVPPLYFAILKNDTAMVALLLENGANPNQKGGVGTVTPLFTAVQYFHADAEGKGLEIVRLLLKHGGDPDIKLGIRNLSALEYAAIVKKSLPLMRLLATKGEVNEQLIRRTSTPDIKKFLQSLYAEKRDRKEKAPESVESVRSKYEKQKNFLFKTRKNSDITSKIRQSLNVMITRTYRSSGNVSPANGTFNGKIVCSDANKKIRAFLSFERGNINGWNLFFNPDGSCIGAVKIKNQRFLEARLFYPAKNKQGTERSKDTIEKFNKLVKQFPHHIAAGKYTFRFYIKLGSENKKDFIPAVPKSRWNGISLIKKTSSQRMLQLNMFQRGVMDGAGLCFDDRGTLLAEEFWEMLRLKTIVYFAETDNADHSLLQKTFAKKNPFILQTRTGAPAGRRQNDLTGVTSEKMLDLTSVQRYPFPLQGHTNKATGLFFPRFLNGFFALWIQTYGKTSNGYSLRYQMGNSKADIYIYDPIFSEKDNDIITKELSRELNNIKSYRGYSHISSPLIKEKHFSSIPSIKYKYAAFTYRVGLGAGLYKHYHSYTLMSFLNNKLIKFRFSSSARSSKAAEREFLHFLEQFDSTILSGRK